MQQTSTTLPIQCKNSADIAAPAGHYSHVCAAGGFAYISGLLPINAQGQALSEASFIEQVEQVLANLDACLECAGLTRDHLVQVRIYLTDMDHWPHFNELYSAWIGTHRPARAVAGVASLHFDSSLEVEAVALLPSAS